MAVIKQISNIKIIGNLKYSDDLRLCLGPTKNDTTHIYNIIPECEIIESKSFMDTKMNYPDLHAEVGGFNISSKYKDLNL